MESKEFDLLFTKQRLPRKKIELGLYQLAEIVSRSVAHEGITQEDLQHELFVFLIRCIEKFQQNGTGKSAYAYFYTCGIRKAYEFCESALKKMNREQVAGADGEEQHGRPAVDRLDLKQKPQKPSQAELVKKLDSVLRKINEQISGSEPETEAYGYGAAGVNWLQCLRFECTGQYLPMTLPTIQYSRSEVRSKAI